eukprot:61060-Rhodomonas_salina.2
MGKLEAQVRAPPQSRAIVQARSTVGTATGHSGRSVPGTDVRYSGVPNRGTGLGNAGTSLPERGTEVEYFVVPEPGAAEQGGELPCGT